MRKTGTCPKCDGKRIMRIASVPDAPVPRRLLTRRTKKPGLLFGETEEEGLTGDVEAYACADRGYFEEYLADPRRLTGTASWAPTHTR
jgi:hypothetical protein